MKPVPGLKLIIQFIAVALVIVALLLLLSGFKAEVKKNSKGDVLIHHN